MSVYRTLTVGAHLSNNQIGVTANVGKNLTAQAAIINKTKISSISDYDVLINKPQINSVTLQGDKSFEELGLAGISNVELEHILT